MEDVIYIALGIAFWLLMAGLAKGCDRLGGGSK